MRIFLSECEKHGILHNVEEIFRYMRTFETGREGGTVEPVRGSLEKAPGWRSRTGRHTDRSHRSRGSRSDTPAVIPLAKVFGIVL